MTENKLLTKVNVKRTICEVHREIWDILDQKITDEEIRKECIEKIEEAYLMAKKMDKKLRQYKFNYDDDWWEKQKNEILQSKKELRQKR